ncbi:MAG: MATE family efflux transporter [Oscillospiraceae bacterium]
MRFELRSKTFYMKTARLMAPVALQQLITVGINFLDNLMIGGFGETQIAAASFGNQFYALFQFICMGLGSGAVVLSSQFWGRQELEPMRRVAAIALRLTTALCALFTLVSVAFPQLILRAFTHEAPVIAAGTPYMRLIGLTFLLAGLTSTATYLLRSVGNVRVPLIGSAAAFFLNLFFNWVFIFGKLGAPRLELVGAAVGTIIARTFEFCFVFGCFVLRDRRFGFRLRSFFLPGGELWRPYLKYGIPVLISDTLLGVSLTLNGVITGHLGEEMATASSIVNTLSQLTNVLSMGIAGAAAIVVGNTIGEGDLDRARREGNSYILLSVALGLVLMPPLLLLEGPYFDMYTIKALTRTMAHGMLLVNVLCLPLQNMANAISKGILRGGGDTRFLLFADSGAVWLISLPLGALAAYVWHMSPVWVYFFLLVQYPLKGIVCFIRYLSGKWLKVITAGEKA